MTGATSPNRVGVVDGGKDQHGRAARGGVGGNGAVPIGQAGGEGKNPRRAVRDRLASQARGACPPATRGGALRYELKPGMGELGLHRTTKYASVWRATRGVDVHRPPISSAVFICLLRSRSSIVGALASASARS